MYGHRKANQLVTTPDLNEMKLPELRQLAKVLGLRGVSSMRKSDLIETITAARSGGQAPAGVTVQPLKQAPIQPVASKKNFGEPLRPTTARRIRRSTEALRELAQERALAMQEAAANAQALAQQEEAKAAAAEAVAATVKAEPVAEEKKAEQPVKNNMEMEVTARRIRKRRGTSTTRSQQDDMRDHAREAIESLDLAQNASRRNRRGEDAPRRGRAAEPSVDTKHELDEILDTLPVVDAGREEAPAREQNRRGRNRNERNNRNNRNDRNERRNRNRDNAPQEERDAAPAVSREEAISVAGVVDVLDSYAFIRTSGYLPGPNDVYVSMGQVKKYGLRKGDAVKGTIRAPHDGDRRNQRQKFVPLQSIDEINGMSVEEAMNRPQFNKLTPLYPNERLRQETSPNRLTGRLIDIVAPIGKGQRGLIVSPPKAGKTITLQNIANAITTNNPEVHLMVVLVDERPEEVTDMERTVQGEVISSTFDRPASDHTIVAELAIERAKRLVELGQDVVVLLDSMTRLARAYNIAAPASGRILSGGVDAQALYPPKKFFGAARNIENGGSLTIISSALVETGSKMDEVIFEEFKGTGNMELRLSRELADKRMFPAIDINASGTRREELITDPHELPVIYRLRRLLGGLEPEQAYQTLVPRLKKTATNRDFFASLVQQGNSSSTANN